MNNKFYNKDWFMWLSLVFLAPLGIILMWKNKRFSTKTRKILSVVFSIWFIVALVIGENPSDNTSNKSTSVAIAKESEKTEETTDIKTESTDDSKKVNGELKVHFINVGQADSILVQQGSNYMLVDAGNNGDKETIKSYLDSQGVKELATLVGTHPHEDHIGGLDYIINSFKIGKIYMPKSTSTTKTFEDVVKSVQNKGMQATAPTPGDTFNLGDAKCTILAPNNSSYEDVNNFSIVIKVEFGDNSFLLAGDAEEISEKEMIDKKFNLKADVLKIGHHGSTSSTSQSFLNTVSPKYAVISVGKENSYGHPAQSTMDRLKVANISVFRTDEQGTIVATSNGTDISFNNSPGSYNGVADSANSGAAAQVPGAIVPVVTPANPGTAPAPSVDTNRGVFFTKSGKSYHYDSSCKTLARSKNILSGTLQEAINSGHADPCDVCVR